MLRALAGEASPTGQPGHLLAAATVQQPSTLSGAELGRCDAAVAELRASMHAGGREGSAAELVSRLSEALACYDALRGLCLQCEEEYNAAARILIQVGVFSECAHFPSLH